MTCLNRSLRREAGAPEVEPGLSGLKVLSLHQALRSPQVPQGPGSQARVGLSGKTDQRNHLLCCVRSDAGGHV